jgi:hypothetical protein
MVVMSVITLHAVPTVAQDTSNREIAREIRQQRFELEALKHELLRQSELIDVLTQQLEQQNDGPQLDGSQGSDSQAGTNDPANGENGGQQIYTCPVLTYRIVRMDELANAKSSTVARTHTRRNF